jgi:hypothetical protein
VLVRWSERPSSFHASANINYARHPHTSTTGEQAQMASVEEVRAGIALANRQATESVAALRQAGTALEQAQSALAMVTQGSAQPDAEQANGLFAQAARSITEAAQSVSAGMSTAEGYAARL